MRLFAFLLFISISLPYQNVNSWDILADVRFESKEEDGYEIDYPIFGERVSTFDGKEIILRGYMVPLENLLGSNYFMLSSLPFNNCFFCGGAGPETVVEVYSIENIEYTDDVIEVNGTLMLNASDPDHHMYILKDSSIQ